MEWGGYDWAWVRYQDYTDPVKLSGWLTAPAPGYVTSLSTGAVAYDYVTEGGHKNIGAWIDRAAPQLVAE